MPTRFNKQRIQLGYQFEKVCQEVFLTHNFTIKINQFIEQPIERETDIIFERGDLNGIAEIKLYSSRTVSPKMIENAVEHFQPLVGLYKINLLIVSSAVSKPYKQQLLEQFSVHIWDITDLFRLTFNNPDLYYELEQLYVQATGESPAEFMSIEFGFELDDLPIRDLKDLPDTPKKTPSPTPAIKTKGEELCEILRMVPSGRSDDDDSDDDDASPDRQYEKACIEILRFLFDRDLALWEDQLTTDAGIHRFDLVCRIRSDHNFWQEIVGDFNSRYVLFEFKNYVNKIKQGQIFTTEKYLFEKGYRMIAFVISKKGADKNALIAAKGAMREQGKLIVNLTDKDLCEMLALYEGRAERHKISDPTEILREKIDEMLTKMIR
ncbi:hypothetical protein [Pedobacter sp. BMA]|uniref:hypothetical protein n=1 Tax=Pedobacter sp. BMA TaxID=1663685 RepID=UPI000649689E|nr:hypothetical protein [Pedobacter sp. BMA]KLT63814.1 hypothetical protein AB669_20475 [Pedobacter sp. BMA]